MIFSIFKRPNAVNIFIAYLQFLLNASSIYIFLQASIQASHAAATQIDKSVQILFNNGVRPAKGNDRGGRRSFWPAL